MELPKSLLGALLIGIAFQTTSCNKDKKLKIDPKPQKPDVTQPGGNQPTDYCPACGMG